MVKVDLNADLGESFGPWVMGHDREMMDIVSSANIACGGHAGDSKTMFDAARTAVEKNVVIGAHPGFEDKEGFGRRTLPLTADEVTRLVAAQVGTLKGVAGLAGGKVRYVKAHGALSNWAARERGVADAIAKAIKLASPECALLAVSGTELETAGLAAGLETYSEIFADRAYGPDGNLVPRSQAGAVIEDPDFACDRLVRFFETGLMPTLEGGAIALKAHSICIHGDNPHAVAMGAQIRAGLEANGLTVCGFLDAG